MAGFVDRTNDQSNNFMKSLLKKLGNYGLEFNDEVLKQSMTVSPTEMMMGAAYNSYDKDLLYALKSSDIGDKKLIAFFDQEYPARRDILNDFATNGEIEMILDTIADEAIIYDNQNYFCKPDLSMILPFLNTEKSAVQDVLDKININFKKIYNYFYFSDCVSGNQLFKQFLIEGMLAFEIIFNKEQTKIIGFSQIDPFSLKPDVMKINGSYRKVWTQYENEPLIKRTLLDSQIIYISYNKNNLNQKYSYLEKLVRSFNILRLLENSRVIWNIMHSTYRIKMIIPIGSQSRKDARETLGELKAMYKEDFDLDMNSGELAINGKANIPFYKNYMLPDRDGEHSEIETLEENGPDLQNVDIIEYFRHKLRVESGIPMSRFDEGNTDGYSYDSANSVTRDEVRFSRFISRLRSLFQEIITKPLYIQTILDFPELAGDFLFKENLGLQFNSNNIFEDLKQMDIVNKRLEYVNALKELGLETGGIFSATYLVKKYLGFSDEELKANQEYLDREKENNPELVDAETNGGGSSW